MEGDWTITRSPSVEMPLLLLPRQLLKGVGLDCGKCAGGQGSKVKKMANKSSDKVVALL